VTQSWKGIVPEGDHLIKRIASVVTATETLDDLRGVALKAAE
jgi:hypothetical protein